jgi:predicted dehydrogenase
MKSQHQLPLAASRRSFLKRMLTAGAAPWFVPASVFGAQGRIAPSNKLSVGVIGVGGRGFGEMQNFLHQDDVRVTAICDVNQHNVARARAKVAERYGSPDVKTYADFRELNADSSIDAVIMALPVHWHSVAALDAILRGKHIFHEKPMALSFEEGRRVRAAVKKKGVVFQFGTQQRSDLKFRWGCELALNGRLGQLKEIQVCAPGGDAGPVYPAQPVPDYVDWDRWVGPAPATSFHEEKLKRNNHENMTAFSLGMISCWGIHHLDIAQWGNGADGTGPRRITGTGEYAPKGDHDALQKWRVRFEYEHAAPMTFVNGGTPGFKGGITFIGEAASVRVDRGTIAPSDESLVRDPRNKCGTMPIALPVSVSHARNFLDAVKQRRRALCDVDAALRSDTLSQLALIAVKRGRELYWDPKAERFENDPAANALLQPRPFRGEWKLPKV